MYWSEIITISWGGPHITSSSRSPWSTRIVFGDKKVEFLRTKEPYGAIVWMVDDHPFLVWGVGQQWRTSHLSVENDDTRMTLTIPQIFSARTTPFVSCHTQGFQKWICPWFAHDIWFVVSWVDDIKSTEPGGIHSSHLRLLGLGPAL